jgi:hypothetical protein
VKPLTPALRSEPAWPTFKSRLLSMIHDQQRFLETVGMNDAEANAARGRIHACRTLIAEVEPERKPTDDEVDRGYDYDT